MPDDHPDPEVGQRLVHRQYTNVKARIEQVWEEAVLLRVENTQRVTRIRKFLLWEHYELLEEGDGQEQEGG